MMLLGVCCFSSSSISLLRGEKPFSLSYYTTSVCMHRQEPLNGCCLPTCDALGPLASPRTTHALSVSRSHFLECARFFQNGTQLPGIQRLVHTQRTGNTIQRVTMLHEQAH